MKSVPLKLLTTVKCFGTVPEELGTTDSPNGYASPRLFTLELESAVVKRCDIRLYEIPDVIPGHEGFTESIGFLKSLAEAIGGTPVLATHRDSHPHPNLKVSVPSYLCLVMPKDGRRMDYEELRNSTTALDVDEVMCFSNLYSANPPQNPHLYRYMLLTALDTDGLGWLAWDLHKDMIRMEPYFLRPLNTLNQESQIQTIQLPLFSSIEEFKMKLALAGGKLQTNQMEYSFSSDLNYFRGMWERR